VANTQIVIAGLPKTVKSVSTEIKKQTHPKDQVNMSNVWKLSISNAIKHLELERVSSAGRFLDLLDRDSAQNLLAKIKDREYSAVAGQSIQFVCYHPPTPRSIINDYSSGILVYKEIGDEDGTTPFSYDPNQDFVTDY
jgi:hypothetical protein